MTVTKIEAVTKTRYKVFLDEQFAFTLYKGELSRFHIAEGNSLEEEHYEELKVLVCKRAKLRAMHLLNDMDRTESQLRQKLKQGGYTEDVTEQAVAYVKSFGYINDEGYVRRFIESRKDKKSKREIYALLNQKGIDSQMAERVLEEIFSTHSEQDAISEIVRKKRWHPAEATDKEKQKMFAYLMRKGFRYEDIRQVIQVSNGNA